MRNFVLFLIYFLFIPQLFANNVILTWDASNPSTNVVGYKAYWGTNSHVYLYALDVSTNLEASITNLAVSTTYYFSATAYNSNRLESGFAQEISYTTPDFVDTNTYVYIGTKLKWWQTLTNVHSEDIPLVTFTNPPNPQFYRQYLIITNNPFTGAPIIDSNNYVYIGTKLQWWKSLTNINELILPIKTFVNPPNPQFYSQFLIITNQPISESIKIGLIGWWKLDEGSGTTAIDSSGNNNNGTLVNGPIWENGSLAFDGVNDIVTLTNPAVFPTAAFTIAAWTKLTTPSANVYYVISWGFNDVSHHIGLGYNGSWRFNSSSLTTGAVSADVWYHIVLTYDGTNMWIYKNSVLAGGYPIVQSAASFVANHVTIGSRNYAGGNSFLYKGSLKDVRVYNYALPPSKVLMLYQGN